MARIYPEGWRTLKATGAALREIETLELLAEALPDTYGVYHGVHWTRVDRRTSFFGEIDFAIICPGGRLILIEQKSGFCMRGPTGCRSTMARPGRASRCRWGEWSVPCRSV